MKSQTFLGIFLGLALLFPSAEAYVKIKCFTLQPPGQILPNVKQIAVLNFDGSGGTTATDVLVTMLLNDKRGIGTIGGGSIFSKAQEGRTYQEWADTRIFNIVERSRLEQIFKEQNLQMSGAIDDNQAVEIGKLLGIDALISGSVTTSQEDVAATEQRTVYRKKEEGGNYQIWVDVVTRKVKANVKIRVIDVKTAQILGSTEGAGNYEKKVDKVKMADLESFESARQGCINSACGQIASYLAPYFLLREFELKKIKVKGIADKAQQAAEFAEKGDLDRAYTIYYSIYQQDPYNIEALYNLGILNDIVGNYTEAKEMFANALMLKSDDEDIQNSERAVSRSLEFAEALASIGMTISKYQWNTSEQAVAAAMAQKVKIEGKSSKKQKVYQEPNDTSSMVAEVPGGVELEVIATEGDWYKVKLLGGKEGYINKKYVK